MSYTIGSILGRAAARLNDAAQTTFTNAVMLPYAQDAGDELQAMLELYGILVLERASTPITIPQVVGFVPGSRVSMKGLGLLPNDMLEPQKLQERLAGTTDLFVDMIRRQWEPSILLTDSLRYWDYREEDIFFVGSTTNRDVIINYIKRLIIITDVNSVVAVNNSQTFMINRIAALSARYIGENATRADELDKEAEANMNWLLGIGVKSKQGT